MKISGGLKTNLTTTMYLIDTNVISEARKKTKANIGVRRFFKQAVEDESRVFISVVTVGELRSGTESLGVGYGVTNSDWGEFSREKSDKVSQTPTFQNSVQTHLDRRGIF